MRQRLKRKSGAADEYTQGQRRIIDAQLAEGPADVKAGRVRGPFSTHKEFIASLHKQARKLSRKKTKRSALDRGRSGNWFHKRKRSGP